LLLLKAIKALFFLSLSVCVLFDIRKNLKFR
jgi:hypothetical protein